MNTVREQQPLGEQDIADIACAFEESVVETLVIKCRRALEQTGFERLVMAGGVAANQRLRARLKETLPNVYYAPAALCTDNGAMVAFAGHVRLAAGEREPLHIETRARWPITELGPIDGVAAK